MTDCELCTKKHPKELWRNDVFYVIDASDENLPGFIRIISSRHVKEMTDLSEKDQNMIMTAVLLAEKIMISAMNPDKVNLAELGNMVPHVHWHVIARYRDDAFFPASIWSEKVRKMPETLFDERRKKAEKMAESLVTALSERFSH